LIPHEKIPQYDEHHEQHDDHNDATEEQANHVAWSETRHGDILCAIFSTPGS